MTLEGGPGDPDTVLRGVEERSDVGLLSLFEHYQSTTVGEHLKTPAFPVWLVCSESHFSVLWQVQFSSSYKYFRLRKTSLLLTTKPLTNSRFL